MRYYIGLDVSVENTAICVIDAADRTVRDIRRKTRKHHSAEEEIRIVLAGLRGEESIAALCRRSEARHNRERNLQIAPEMDLSPNLRNTVASFARRINSKNHITNF